jgi:hypothetical protein
MSSNITWTIGDTLPKVEAVLKDRNGPVNLTGALVRFVSNMGVNAAATVVTPASGAVEFTPTGITLKSGLWTARFVVTFGNGSVLSFPNSDPYLYLEVVNQDA